MAEHCLVYLLLHVICILVSPIPGCHSRSCDKINAAFTVGDDNATYILSGTQFIKYSFVHDSEETVGGLSKLGLSPGLVKPDAAFTMNGAVHILKRCEIFRYRMSGEATFVKEGETTTHSLGLPCDVDAAISWAGHVLAFKGCNIWKYDVSTHQFEPEGPVEKRGLPCNLDAAVQWKSSGAIFVRGAQFWKFDTVMRGPFHTDELNICSWYLCGEADWMREKRVGNMSCNGDERLCPLRLDQVTMAGLHNAGSGYDEVGFGFLNCWLQNHALSINKQMKLGIRHLDIDPCYDTCGLLGTCHSFVCGGSICPIIKQVRSFLRDNKDEVVTINFNHEIVNPEKVFQGLNRQLQTQMGPLLNKKFRQSREKKWPTLGQSIRANKRVFVFYAPVIESSPHNKLYQRYKWIHSENFYGSTWRPFSVHYGCDEVVNLTAARCEVRKSRELVEVSIIPEKGGCIDNMAEKCRPFLHQALRACEGFRFERNDSPNVLLVDYPEVDSGATSSVFHAVYHQNVRNIHKHRSQSCRVKVNAAVRVSQEETLFFIGKKIIVYSHSRRAQVGVRDAPDLYNIDAAYGVPERNAVRIVKGCETWDVDATSLLPLSRERRALVTCNLDAAVVWLSQLHTFKGCNVTTEGSDPTPLVSWGLPCQLDAVLHSDGKLFVFRDNSYWKYTGKGVASLEGHTLDWTIDAVQCGNSNI
ncbi:unnamed protein product [Lymnaea stagnalis]|uniref:Uncharacterized protein n=1 Tax=Lymnaea stagnalis TaxID=6523 RepID=A0AAV2GXF0_LYMST